MPLPAGITTGSFVDARESLDSVQVWLLEDTNHHVIITAQVTDPPAAVAFSMFDSPQAAKSWVDERETYSATETPPIALTMQLSYQDNSIIPVENKPAPVAKELPDSLKSIITTSGGSLIDFANSLYNWSQGTPAGCLTATCLLSPSQPGFANTFNAPDLNSMTSWISSVAAYIDGGASVTAAIVVTSVLCGSTGFGTMTE